MGVDPAHGSEQCLHVYRSSTVHHGTRHACSSLVGLSLLACLFAGKLKAHFEDADIKYIEPTTMIRCASKQCNVWTAGTLGQPLQLQLVDVGSMRLRRVVTHVIRALHLGSPVCCLVPAPQVNPHHGRGSGVLQNAGSWSCARSICRLLGGHCWSGQHACEWPLIHMLLAGPGLCWLMEQTLSYHCAASSESRVLFFRFVESQRAPVHIRRMTICLPPCSTATCPSRSSSRPLERWTPMESCGTGTATSSDPLLCCGAALRYLLGGWHACKHCPWHSCMDMNVLFLCLVMFLATKRLVACCPRVQAALLLRHAHI